MLTPALRVEPDPQAHGPPMCEHRRFRKPAVPRRLNAPTPNVGDRRGGNPRHERGVLRARLLRPAGRHAMVVAHFLIRPATPSTWGRVESAPLMAGAVALASTGLIAAIDEKAWAGPRRLARASRVPHSVSRHCHGDSSRAEYARRKVESSFLERGLDRSQLRPPGTGCSPANGTLRRLRRLARPCVLSIALPLRFYYDLPNVHQNLWGAYSIECVITNILGRPATGRVTSRRIVPESAKRHPQFVR